MRVGASHALTGARSNTVNTALAMFTAATLHIFQQLLHKPLVMVDKYDPDEHIKVHVWLQVKTSSAHGGEDAAFRLPTDLKVTLPQTFQGQSGVRMEREREGIRGRGSSSPGNRS